jgi:putative ABC transport system substrate-binding protein
MALLVNPTNPMVGIVLRDSQAAAAAFGMKLHILHASDDRDSAPLFTIMAQVRAEALVIGIDNFFTNRSKEIAGLTALHRVPAIYQYPEFTAAGGLMSFGGTSTETWRLAGVYVGRILKGETLANLPVQEVTKVELIINLKTAKALGLEIPATLLARADEVIE